MGTRETSVRRAAALPAAWAVGLAEGASSGRADRVVAVDGDGERTTCAAWRLGWGWLERVGALVVATFSAETATRGKSREVGDRRATWLLF